MGEGNGNPLQCSCLENPRDGGAWWAAVYGVTQSRTWLKWLSSSSSMSCLKIISSLPLGDFPLTYPLLISRLTSLCSYSILWIISTLSMKDRLYSPACNQLYAHVIYMRIGSQVLILFGSFTCFRILLKLLVLLDTKKAALEDSQFGLQMAAFSISAHTVFSWCMCLKGETDLFFSFFLKGQQSYKFKTSLLWPHLTLIIP